MKPIRVLFVCLGNICRSPTAHGIFEKMVRESGLEEQILIDSAGTGDWHIGRPPDRRASAAALDRGHDLSHLRARQVRPEDFRDFDYILAMDEQNLWDLKALALPDFDGHLGLFLDFGHSGLKEVPDPYYGGEENFAQVLDLVEDAASGLLSHLREQLD
ncbi:MAG: low molecular weight phosphotyrosine protein phosphatase [Gammaproteobacteria bacterium]|nr:MAG: low molecular weight phosphotyrosine protein phosphatase [Gammaproteobacteria bacterium]